MEISEKILSEEEKLALQLREKYLSFGYSRFKMSRFEEYDLYARNKDVLISNGVITFTDTNGHLLALKPDVTLSIIKNCKDDGVQKFCYDENVYRISPRTHDFQEIMQAGLECIGEIDEYCVCEVVMLALESLRCTGCDYILDLAHVGIADAMADKAGLTSQQRGEVYSLIGQKNLHELRERCAQIGTDPEPFCTLASLGGETAQEGLDILKQICAKTDAGEIYSELQKTICALSRLGHEQNLRLDFSILSDMRYYSGIVFKGYLRGVPETVLSGGRYDKLLRRMGKQAGGVGFAVYLDVLERLRVPAESFDADVLLLYRPQDDPFEVFQKAAELSNAGEQVIARSETPRDMRFRRVVRLQEGGRSC